MPRYSCSFAYDVPHYFDFVVEAESEEEAQKKMEAALAASQFDGVIAEAQPCYENQCNERVFIQGETKDAIHEPDTTLDEVIAKTQEKAA